MTSMPASRNARAMIFAPRSCPSRPGFAITTRIVRAMPRGSLETTRAVALLDRAVAQPRAQREPEGHEDREPEQRAGDDEPDRAERAAGRLRLEPRRQRLGRLRGRRLGAEDVLRHHRVDEPAAVAHALELDRVRDRALLRALLRMEDDIDGDVTEVRADEVPAELVGAGVER